MKECTFQPQIQRSISPQYSAYTRNQKDLIARQQLDISKRQNAQTYRNQMKQEQIEQELQDCTFQPSLSPPQRYQHENKSPKTPKGYEQTVHRLRIAHEGQKQNFKLIDQGSYVSRAQAQRTSISPKHEIRYPLIDHPSKGYQELNMNDKKQIKVQQDLPYKPVNRQLSFNKENQDIQLQKQKSKQPQNYQIQQYQTQQDKYKPLEEQYKKIEEQSQPLQKHLKIISDQNQKQIEQLKTKNDQRQSESGQISGNQQQQQQQRDILNSKQVQQNIKEDQLPIIKIKPFFVLDIITPSGEQILKLQKNIQLFYFKKYRKAHLELYKDNDIYQKAEDFSKQYNLDENTQSKIEKILDQQMQKYLQKIQHLKK